MSSRGKMMVSSGVRFLTLLVELIYMENERAKMNKAKFSVSSCSSSIFGVENTCFDDGYTVFYSNSTQCTNSSLLYLRSEDSAEIDVVNVYIPIVHTMVAIIFAFMILIVMGIWCSDNDYSNSMAAVHCCTASVRCVTFVASIVFVVLLKIEKDSLLENESCVKKHDFPNKFAQECRTHIENIEYLLNILAVDLGEHAFTVIVTIVLLCTN